jgi:hydroxyquinol 1,2-dioxygenase
VQQAALTLTRQQRTDEKGCIEFRTVKPSGYPIPVDGPVGQLTRAQGRYNLRPAHIHFMIHRPVTRRSFRSCIRPTTPISKPTCSSA